MPSLLDSIIQNRTRIPSANELIQERARQRGLLAGADVPEPTPSIFNPRPGGGQPGNLRALQGAAQLAGAPGPEAADPRQVQGAVQDAGAEMKRRGAAFMASTIARHNNGQLPESAERYVREVVEDNVNSGAGKPGRGWLGRLYGGEKIPGLSEVQNRRILQESLLNAGLTMLGSGGNLGQALAAGILMARLSSTETAGQMVDEQRRQQRLQERYSILSNADLTELERWQEIRRRSAAEGDLDAAEAAQDIIKDLKDRAAGEAERTPQVVNGQLLFTDDRGNAFDASGRRLEAPDLPKPEPDRVKPIQRTRQLPDGREIAFLADPFTGEPIPGSEVVSGVPSGDGGQPDADKAQVAAELRREVDNIRSILGDDPETEDVEGADRFGVTGTFGRLARILPAEMEPSDLKQMRAASENILSLIVRQRSGAQATDAEVERLKSFAIPKAGDDPSTVRSKLERMEAIISDFERGGANAAVDPIMRTGERDVDAELDSIFGAGGS